MSIKVNVDDLSEEQRVKIDKDLIIKIEPGKYGGGFKYIYPYEVVGNTVILPFGFAVRELKLKRPDRTESSKIDITFEATLRDQQIEVKKEAIEILKTGSVIISSFAGWGKCTAFGTEILMYDGKIKMVQDIKIGDQIMGDDSKPRNILSLCRGEEQMYEIKPIKGGSFKCNESHILSLAISANNTIYKPKNKKYWQVRQYDKENNRFTFKCYETEEKARESVLEYEKKYDNILDISVKDYLKLPKPIKHLLKSYKVGVEFNEKPISLDPYLLGLWLGDGTSAKSEITSADDEIVNYIKNYCKDNNLRLHQGKISKTTRNDYHYEIYGSTYYKPSTNPFLQSLKQYNLINNKHIPYEYKCNSRENRLKLLAGIIDTDGYCEKNCYEITQKNKVLANDIVYLARSLGFAAYVKEVKKYCIYKGEKKEGIYNKICILGDGLENIPVLLERKKASTRKNKSDVLRNGFKVIPIDEKQYYGFEIDGNRRFLLGDFTVTHNTIISISLACSIKLKCLVVVNKLVLMKQWEDSINRFCPKAIVQLLTPKSELDDKADFYVMNAVNIPKMGREFFKNIKLLIVDEIHLIMAEKLSVLMKYIFPRYLIGLSATPYRTDGLDILLDLYYGKTKIVREMNQKHLVYKVQTEFKPKVEYTEAGKLNWSSILDSQAEDEKRNQLILNIIQKFQERIFLVLVKRVKHGKYLVDQLLDRGESVTSLLGSNQEFDREARILVATSQKAGCGFDHPRLDALLLPTDFENFYIQILARVFRRRDVEPIVFDIVDDHPILFKHYKSRREICTNAGGKIKMFFKDFPELEIKY